MIASRIGAAPIIHAGMSASLGSNINGPSLIRVPDWVSNPLGRYYLYFAHHKGRFMRMAYADEIAGPWTIHQPGVLDVEDSLFVVEDLDKLPGDAGEWARTTGSDFLYAHVASPDLHVDHDTKLIRMYFHGLLPDGEQRTRLATSPDGLNFTPQTPTLGTPYFRAFRHREYVYAIAWGGALLRARSWEGPFETGPPLLSESMLVQDETIIRHVAVHCEGDALDLYFTRIGDCPERVLFARIDLGPDWSHWRVNTPNIVLSPELAWEGVNLPITISTMGAITEPEHALRDPCLFIEGGKTYLLYCGAGESAIGLAQLH